MSHGSKQQMWHSPQPSKLYAALTWRENDERTLKKAKAAISKARKGISKTIKLCQVLKEEKNE